MAIKFRTVQSNDAPTDAYLNGEMRKGWECVSVGATDTDFASRSFFYVFKYVGGIAAKRITGGA